LSDHPTLVFTPVQSVIQRQIDATHAQIDKLVYELYGLSAEEIKIVEKTAASAP